MSPQFKAVFGALLIICGFLFTDSLPAMFAFLAAAPCAYILRRKGYARRMKTASTFAICSLAGALAASFTIDGQRLEGRDQPQAVLGAILIACGMTFWSLLLPIWQDLFEKEQ